MIDKNREYLDIWQSRKFLLVLRTKYFLNECSTSFKVMTHVIKDIQAHIFYSADGINHFALSPSIKGNKKILEFPLQNYFHPQSSELEVESTSWWRRAFGTHRVTLSLHIQLHYSHPSLSIQRNEQYLINLKHRFFGEFWNLVILVLLVFVLFQGRGRKGESVFGFALWPYAESLFKSIAIVQRTIPSFESRLPLS